MQRSTFNFDLTSTNPEIGLGFECWINDQQIFNCDSVSENMTVTGNLPSDDVEAEHVLKLVLKNKQTEHTRLSESGEILNDACLTVSNLTFDSIKLGQIVNDLSIYEHDFNGTQSATKQQFFGTMGCNGTVELKFSTPIYLWLLENM